MGWAGFWERLTRQTRRLRQRSDWPHFAGADFADHIMDVAVTDDFHAKQGRSTGRWVLRNNGDMLVVYLKRHRRLPWWRRLLATLWPGRGWSPAFTEWRNLEWATAHGIPVPASVAAGEMIGPWFRFESFLAVEELSGMMPLHEAIPLVHAQLAPLVFRSWKRSVIAEAARLSRLLHGAQRFHKDLYLCHFFVPAALMRKAPRVYLIDLHRLGRHRWTRQYWRIKDLAQLLYSSFDVPGVTDRDRLAFLHAYEGCHRLSAAGRRLLHVIRLKARWYRRQNSKSVAPLAGGSRLNKSRTTDN